MSSDRESRVAIKEMPSLKLKNDCLNNDNTKPTAGKSQDSFECVLLQDHAKPNAIPHNSSLVSRIGMVGRGSKWFATGASVGASAFGGQDLQPLLRSHRNW